MSGMYGDTTTIPFITVCEAWIQLNAQNWLTLEGDVWAVQSDTCAEQGHAGFYVDDVDTDPETETVQAQGF